MFVCLFVCFRILLIYLRERKKVQARERERERALTSGGRGREGADSPLSREPQCGAQFQDPGIMT